MVSDLWHHERIFGAGGKEHLIEVNEDLGLYFNDCPAKEEDYDAPHVDVDAVKENLKAAKMLIGLSTLVFTGKIDLNKMNQLNGEAVARALHGLCYDACLVANWDKPLRPSIVFECQRVGFTWATFQLAWRGLRVVSGELSSVFATVSNFEDKGDQLL